MKIFKSILEVGAACLVLAIVSGCGSTGPDAKVEQSRTQAASNYRQYFDKVKGDYTALSADDKAAFVKMSGGEDKAQKFWDQMKHPGSANNPGANAPGSGATSGNVTPGPGRG